MSAAVRRYIHAGAEFTSELERLRLLEARYDAQTIRRLRALGPLAGAHCLEVAAGAGSVARWLAGEVGAGGWVVATDADPRFLGGLVGPNLEVRRHDILTDALPEATYDLVHCRALLLHLGAPQRALERMVAALRPGGWLLV
ncbi:MAG: class I SAM-dependent methyltransferase, partial [Candidatus Rokubacteria bacterium]|nr:class I SAM-dependent methyltransferase [Candidatus Rokubacteria bacterium]